MIKNSCAVYWYLINHLTELHLDVHHHGHINTVPFYA